MSRPAYGRCVPRAAALVALLALGSVACAAPEGRSSNEGAGVAGQRSPDAAATASEQRSPNAERTASEQRSPDAAATASDTRASDATAAVRTTPAHSHDVDASAAVAKPTAPISITHRWLAPPAVGAALALRLEIGSERRLGDVVVELDGGRSLVVDAGSQAERVPEIEAGATHAFEPAVLAAESGTHYLAVSVTADIAGARQTRSVTIPVRLGGEAIEREADAAKSGERVRSLPVEERSGRR